MLSHVNIQNSDTDWSIYLLHKFFSGLLSKIRAPARGNERRGYPTLYHSTNDATVSATVSAFKINRLAASNCRIGSTAQF